MPNSKPSLQEIYDELPETYQQILYKLAEKMHSQAEKGREKYGMTIDNSSKDVYYWQESLLEEMADGLAYLQKLLSLSK